jgi:hypothetical protein
MKGWRAARNMSPTTKCAVVLRDEHLCAWCSDLLVEREAHSIDHVIARSAGGKSVATNLVLSCIPCNGAKREGRASFAAYLLKRGIKLEVALAEVKRRLALPVDRKAGRALADRWYPGLYAKKAAREKRRQQKLRDARKVARALGVEGGVWFEPSILEAM